MELGPFNFIFYLLFLCANYSHFFLHLSFKYAGFIQCPHSVAAIRDNLTWNPNSEPPVIKVNGNISSCYDGNLNSNCALNTTPEENGRGMIEDEGLQSAVEFGMHLSFKECQLRFKWGRWNCSKLNWLANTGTKENAYVTAINAAAVTYSIAKACARGDIHNCGCAPPTTISSGLDNPLKSNMSTSTSTLLHQGGYWRWGGCSADVDFAVKLARRSTHKLVSRKLPRSSNEIDEDTLKTATAHNTRVGRNIVQKSLDTDCKCHGVSGSCTLKTCWMKLPQFGKIGKMMFNLYKKSTLVIPQDDFEPRRRAAKVLYNSTKHTKRRIILELSEGGQKPTQSQLIHLVASPTYCDPDGYYVGTRGRRCLRHSVESPFTELEGSCSILCCGRGYNTHVTWRRWKCHCVFHLCCVVECQDCQEKVQIYTCN